MNEIDRLLHKYKDIQFTVKTVAKEIKMDIKDFDCEYCHKLIVWDVLICIPDDLPHCYHCGEEIKSFKCEHGGILTVRKDN